MEGGGKGEKGKRDKKGRRRGHTMTGGLSPTAHTIYMGETMIGNYTNHQMADIRHDRVQAGSAKYMGKEADEIRSRRDGGWANKESHYQLPLTQRHSLATSLIYYSPLIERLKNDSKIC